MFLLKSALRNAAANITPLDKTYMAKAIAASKYCKDDQDSLRQKVNEWQASGNGKFLYRPKGQDVNNGKDSSGQKFLFVHQEVWQQRLLKRYGSELVLLDATARPLSTHCRYFSSVSTPTLATKLWRSSFAKTKMRSPLLKHFTSLKVGMSGGTVLILWWTTQLQRSTPLKRNFQLP